MVCKTGYISKIRLDFGNLDKITSIIRFIQNDTIIKLENQISNKKNELNKLKNKDLQLTYSNENKQKQLDMQYDIHKSLQLQYKQQQKLIKKLEKEINRIELKKK